MAIEIDPHLEDRSLLKFEFKKSDGTPITRVLNFLENIEISESLETNYSEYTPIGSNGSVFAYLGSKSRKLDINFNLTLPNILQHSIVKSTAYNRSDKDGLKSSYFVNEDLAGSIGEAKPRDKFADLIRHFDIDFYTSLTESEKQVFANSMPGLTLDIISNIQGGASVEGSDPRLIAIFQVVYWLNLIRASCITNAKKPYLGPPIITLNHGIMYMSVPCICQSYKISHDETAGYDATTMLPRRLKVSMNLREVRLRGKDFIPTTGTSKYQAGWDALFDENKPSSTGFTTLDPLDNDSIILL